MDLIKELTKSQLKEMPAVEVDMDNLMSVWS